MAEAMSGPSTLKAALRVASPCLLDPTKVYTACGFSWDGNDILRFLGFCRWQEHPERPGHFCLIWHGGKSRGGKGTSPDKRGRKRGQPKNCYGTFSTKGKSVRAHKFWAVAVRGLRPSPDQELDHECHLTLCVSDIRLLAKAENQARIRRRRADREGTQPHNHAVRGSRKPGTRLKVLRGRFVKDAFTRMEGQVRAAVEQAIADAISP